MALVSTVGLGSGLDIGSLVKQLVDAERAAPSAALNRREARTKAQISAVGQVSSAFSTLKAAVDKLRAGTAFEARKVTSNDTERLTATIRSGQTPALGTYTLEIDSLATAQKLQSDPTAVTAADTVLGTGTLSFTVNGASFDVVVTDSNNDIYALASAINSAAAGKVQAAVVRGDTGYSLSLTSGSLGSAGEISISQTAGGSSLSAFTYNPASPAPGTLTEQTPADDAVFFIDGVRRTSSSNVVGDAIDGLELTLKKAEIGKSFTVSVSEDRSGAQAAVQGFVTAYNAALGTLRKVSAYDQENNTAQALNGDAFVRSATTQLRNFISDAFRAAAAENIKLGIDTTVDGSLEFNAATFNANLSANPNAVKALYSGEGAVLTRNVHAFLESVIGQDGSLVQRRTGLDTRLKSVTRDRDALDRRMLAVEDRYRKQFVALDGLLGKLNNTSQYLSQQLAGLAASQGG
ncbi:flagellar filament capping protein FliD [Pseudomarimonas salicorniae]|uniref:Flagellar hook-associated protein 2 n=1 Tax=Pseudomarimonas salicorniae TaxID=2933270 RepID=A0ABT0GM99_9GAMM|nr:flagellar filament capping protein FliD [Lysobacter sp. CAU 1642]MCK7595155.1 flagellar filament capping protein FliD [Lysobacter sp. CAU 1642]